MDVQYIPGEVGTDRPIPPHPKMPSHSTEFQITVDAPFFELLLHVK